ncbi:MAG: bifunctional nuclease family protein [Candidatus Margulisiibacteriota bacterium]
MINMQLGGLGFDPRNMSPIVLLRDPEERNFLPIWIGMFEAAAIAMELQGYSPPRPMTHDLMASIIEISGYQVHKVIISEVKDDTFYAIIELVSASLEQVPVEEKDIVRLDSRPSDAIALAVRTDAPIYVSETVMVKAKMVNAEKDKEETKKFQEFIENINPEDFKKYYDKQ